MLHAFGCYFGSKVDLIRNLIKSILNSQTEIDLIQESV